MADTVRINGQTYNWSSVYLTINGVSFFGVTEINWDEKLERAFGYGLGKHYSPQQRTAGKYTPDPMKLVVLATAEETFNDILLGALTDQGYAGSVSLGKAEVTIQVTYDETGLGPVTLVAIGAALEHRGGAFKEGPDVLSCPADFSVMRYVRTVNGKVTTLWDSDETGPV